MYDRHEFTTRVLGLDCWVSSLIEPGRHNHFPRPDDAIDHAVIEFVRIGVTRDYLDLDSPEAAAIVARLECEALESWRGYEPPAPESYWRERLRAVEAAE